MYKEISSNIDWIHQKWLFPRLSCAHEFTTTLARSLPLTFCQSLLSVSLLPAPEWAPAAQLAARAPWVKSSSVTTSKLNVPLALAAVLSFKNINALRLLNLQEQTFGNGGWTKLGRVGNFRQKYRFFQNNMFIQRAILIFYFFSV